MTESTEMTFSVGSVLATVGMAAITGLGAAVSSWLNYKTARDKMAFDAERVKMKTDIEHLKEKVDSCHEERDALEKRCESLEERDRVREVEVADLRRRWDERSATHAPLDRRKADNPNYNGPKTRKGDNNQEP